MVQGRASTKRTATGGRPPKAAGRRGRTPSGDVEGALLDAAERLLEREGPTGLSVRKLAAEAGVAPMGVYNHFEGKNGIVDALFRRGFATLASQLDVMAAEPDPIAALAAGADAYRRFALDHPTTYAVMFLRAVAGYEPSDEAKATAGASFEVLASTVARGLESNVLPEGDADELAQQLWSAIHGAVALELAEIGFCDDPAFVFDDLVATLLRGMATPAATDR